VTVPSRVAVDQPFTIRVTVQNLGAGTAEGRVEVAVGDRSFARTVSVGSSDRETVSIQGSIASPGTYEVRAGDVRRSITVESAASIRIGAVPASGPPNATVLVPVRDVGGRPLANATVSVGGRTARTNGQGIARIRLPATPGDYRIRATAPGKEPTTAPISVETGALRVPLVNASVSPSEPTVVTRPTVTVTVRNPWNRSFARTVGVTRDDGTRQVLRRSVELGPGDRAELAVRLDRAAVGAHELTVTIDGTPVRGVEYTVQGDERVVSSVATGGRYDASTGLGRSIRSVFGNLEVLLATLLVLVALATVGTVTAAFTSTIHAQRRTIGIRRAAGAHPRQILVLVVGDAARLSIAGTVPALAIGVLSVDALRELGITTVFGISVAPGNPIPVLALAAVAGVGLAVCGGALATLPMIRRPPAELFD